MKEKIIDKYEAIKNNLSKNIKSLSVRDYVDIVIYSIIGLNPVGGVVSSASSTIAMKQVQKRMGELEKLTPIIEDLRENEDRFFEHRKIILKFIEDSDILDEDLQDNITNYIINCKDRKYYKFTIDFLLKTPTFKINNMKKFQYDSEKMSHSIGVKEDELVNTPLLDLASQVVNNGRGYSEGIEYRPFTAINIEILYYCLKLLNEDNYPSIDKYIQKRKFF